MQNPGSKTNIKKAGSLFLVSLLTVGVLASGCRKAPSQIPTDEPPPADEQPMEPVPANPGDDNNDGATDLPQEPIDTPEPLPAPPTPVNPGQHMILKAVAKTSSYVLPVGGVSGVYVNIDVTWQPVRGAKEYLLFKNILPQKHEVTRTNAYKIVNAEGLMSTKFVDGMQPPSFAGGNIWEKIKRGFNAITLKPGVEYKYKVFAVDLDGNILAESDADTTVPLPPVSSAANLKVSETHTQKPLFEWEETNGAKPDGYFVSVYPPIQFGKQAFQPQGSFGLAYWSTFRDEATKVARYGAQSDNLAAYPGNLPFNISFPLRMNNRYSVSVTAVKTDSKDMRTAKAISKSWSESKIFTVGSASAPVPGTPAPAPSTPPDSSSGSSGGFFKKVKDFLGL